MTNRTNVKLYTKQARKGYTGVDKNKFLDKIRRSLQSKIFFEYIKNKESKILDIGCGGGKFLNILSANNYCNTFGVEPDQQLIEGLLAEFPEFKDRIKCSGATTLPFEDSFFDCVYFFNVMHHLQGMSEYRKAIDESHRVLRENGLLIMIEPCNAFIYSLKRNLALMLSHVSEMWADMYEMMIEEKELMGIFIAESYSLNEYILNGMFKLVQNTKHFHQSVLVVRK